MRYLTLIILVSLISGCSFWPFGKEKTGSCLDDDSCDTPASLEQQLVTNATWYCYGVSRDDGWDCSQEEDQTRIAVIPDQASPTPQEEAAAARAEMFFEDETISHQQPQAAPTATSAMQSGAAPVAAADKMMTNSKSQQTGIFGFSDSAWAVQLIALQTMAEVDAFAAAHDLEAPNAVRIRSQGVDWYVMILGVFDDRSAADAAAEAWTDSQQPYSKPWVRPLGPLKQAALEAQSSGD